MTNERARDVSDATLREFVGGQKLFGRYTLIKVLGRGGMGIVWLARDEKLERDVALKFLPDMIIHDRALLDDLKRETRRSLELTHKNIVRIYDFVDNETSGCISMEYVDGETLSILRAEKEQKVFEPNELSGWTAQLCDALDYAHNHARIIHRDLKPANLMVNQRGDLKVSDFGIARSLGDTFSRLTMEQGRSGTLVYMSPQQLDGERGTHLDDVYSLGATLYDLLTSKPPFYSGNVDRQVHDRVAPSMTDRRKEFDIEPPSLPAVWEEAVAACLAKDPVARPQSAAEVAARLQLSAPQTTRPIAISEKRPKRKVLLGAGIVALLLLVALAGWQLSKRQRKPVVATANTPPAQAAVIPEKSIAVLPLENLSAEKENAFFADGIQDDIMTSLAKIADLKVISRTSVMQYRGAGVTRNLRDIAQALGVANILEGTVRRVGNRALINVQLIDPRDGRQIWAERYDRTIADSIGLQGELATEIAAALKAKLAPEEKARLAAKPTTNPEAYLFYLRALERARTAASKQDAFEIDDLYAKAIELDPAFALAIARRSMWNSLMFTVGRRPPNRAAALALAAQALQLSPDLPEAHVALGLGFYWIEKDYPAALREFSTASAALALEPDVLDYTAEIYCRQGRWREGLAAYDRLQEIDPRHAHTGGASTRASLRDWPAAVAGFQRLLAIEPNNISITLDLARLTLQPAGDFAAARKLLAGIPPGLHGAPGQPSMVDVNITQTSWEIDMLARDYAAAEKVLADYKADEFIEPVVGAKTFDAARLALARGDADSAKLLFEKVRPIYETGARDHPDFERAHARLGRLYAYLGRKVDAIRESLRAVELCPESKDAVDGPTYAVSLAFVYARTGEVDQAITLIERLLVTPNGISLTDLRLNWDWDSLRSDARFKQIIRGPEPTTVY